MRPSWWAMAPLVLLALAACARGPAPSATRIAASTSTTSATRDAARSVLACDGARRDATMHPLVRLAPAWHAETGAGSGAFALDAVDGRLVARVQGGRTVSLDAETGGSCVVLVDGPRAPGAASNPIDPYSARTAVLHGALVGPSKSRVSAVDVRTGELVWSREIASGSHDEYSLRDGLHTAATRSADIFGFALMLGDVDSYRFEEIVTALDPKTGAEKWRKVVVRHGRGEPLQIEGTIRLAGDGDRVFVRTNGKLAALDEATGDEAWSVAWPWAPRIPGPETPETKGPQLAAGEGLVALALPGRVQLHDARTGSRRAEASVPGVATELAIRGGVVFAAVEATPGNAALVAIDATTGRTLWSRRAAYSIARMRVDADKVYSSEGDGRVWAFVARDGAPVFGMTNPSVEFAVARTSAGASRVFVLDGGVTAFDPPRGSRPAPQAPYLRWETAETTGSACHPRALSWIDGDEHVTWERAVPARFGAVSFGDCGELEMSSYRRRPRANAPLLYLVYGSSETDDAIVVGDETGVLALKKSDGALAFDFEAPRNRGGLMFDSGTFTLDGEPRCEGPAHHARVFARCGDRIVYFNGTTAALVAPSPWRVEARATFSGPATGPPLRPEASLPLGTRTLTLKGTIYTR